MTERGEYRSIHSVIIDTPDFIDLGATGQLVWFHLKLRLGATGIGVLNAAEFVLAEATGCHSDAIPNAIASLIQGGWLVRERNVFWLRNGLRYEPSRSLANTNHVKGITTHLAGLPKLKIVNDFADYYDLPRPFPDLPESNGIPNGIGDGIPNGIGKHGRRSTEDGVRKTEDGISHTPREAGVVEAESSDRFNEFYQAVGDCPLLHAEAAYHWAVPELVSHEELIEKRKRYVAKQSDPKYAGHIDNWIRAKGWADPTLDDDRDRFAGTKFEFTPEEIAQLAASKRMEGAR